MGAVFGIVAVTAIVTFVTVLLMLVIGGEALLDTPNARSSHAVPTPRGGGLGIWLGLVAGLLVWWIFEDDAGDFPPVTAMLVVAIVTVVSFLDDLYSLPYRLRLLVQGAATVMLLWVVGPFEVVQVPLVGLYWVPLSGLLLSVFWCLALTNAYNFLDGIDGIAAIQGIVGGLAWGAIGSIINQPVITLLGLMVAAGCGAFIWFNWHPARIFMGDVGSATLGMLFATIPLVASALTHRAGWAAPAGALIVWPFLYDAGVTMLRRLARGENIFEGHRSHFYQRLVLAGWNHRRTARLYGLLALATGAGAVGLAGGSTLGGVLAWVSAIVTCVALPVLVQQAERQARAGLSSDIPTISGAITSGH
ncbi:MAG: glycosyltransferase family 4 protein [Gemmatimonadales bacterium]